MARIAGVNLRPNAHISIALTDIYGIGRPRAKEICEKANLPLTTKVKELTEEMIKKLQDIIATYEVEGDLHRFISMRIKRLIDLRCFRGLRHKLGLPVRGQRTKTNAKTRKGRRRGKAKAARSDKK